MKLEDVRSTEKEIEALIVTFSHLMKLEYVIIVKMEEKEEEEQNGRSGWEKRRGRIVRVKGE